MRISLSLSNDVDECARSFIQEPELVVCETL